MAVNIPINASAGGAVDAIKAIQQAIERAGQSGREFAKLDLSHPELAGMAEDIRRLAARFQDLSRVGRGATATAFRGVSQGSTDPLMWEHRLNTAFPDPTERERHRRSVLSYAAVGTRWQQPVGGAAAGRAALPRAGAGLAAEGEAITGSAATGGMLGGTIGGFIGGPAGALALGGIMAAAAAGRAMIGPSIRKAQEEADGNEDLYRHTDLSQSFDQLREAARKAADGLQLTYQEAGRLGLEWAKLTGDNNPASILANVRMGAGMGRAFGMDPGLTTQGLGQAVNLGLAPEKFATLVGEAAAKGGRSADETMPALLRLAEAATRSLVTHSSIMDSGAGGAAMLAGLNAMGLPGFRGANAEALMNTLGASIYQGGNAGMGSAALSFRVGQRQGVSDPYDLKLLQEGGLFASAKSDLGYGSSETNFQARLGELQRMYAGQPQNRLLNAMENDLGINMRQGRELLRYKPADIGTTFRALQDAHVDLKTINPSAIADAVRIANAGPTDLETERATMLGRHGAGALSAEDQKTLSDAGPGSLRNVLLKMEGKYGQNATEGNETREAMASLSNAMTKVGQDLLAPLNSIKDLTASVVDRIGDLGTILRDTYKAGVGGDAEAHNRLTGGGQIGGPEPGITDAIKKARADEAMAFFQSKEGGGYTKAQAAGIVAQIAAESDFQAHGPRGDGGLAVGAFQHHPDRQAAIAKRFGKRLEDMSFHEQLQAYAWEMSDQGPEAAAGQSLRGTTTAFGAGYNQTVNDLRPSFAPMKGMSRGQTAERLMNPGAPPISVDVNLIHRSPSGDVLGTTQLPTTTVYPPTPSGMQPPVGPRAAPPKPPPPKLDPALLYQGFAF